MQSEASARLFATIRNDSASAMRSCDLVSKNDERKRIAEDTIRDIVNPSVLLMAQRYFMY
jgi:hypothetical protein